MEVTTPIVAAWLAGTSAHPVDVEANCSGVFCETEPMIGLALMATGLMIYTTCLCIRDRWWQWGN